MNDTMLRWCRVAVLLGSLSAFCSIADAAPPAAHTLHENWQFRLLPADPQAAQHSEAASWRPANVPGEVHTDLLAQGLIPDPYVGTGEAQLQWIGLADWEYRGRFDLDAGTLAHRHLDLIFAGLDTYAEVELNGRKLLDADNMFRTWRMPAKGLLREHNELRVVFRSPIRRWLSKVQAETAAQRLPAAYPSAFGDEPKDVQTSPYVRKAAYHYGWDWGPRFVTAGIWRAVRLEAWSELRIADLHIRQIDVTAEAATLEAHVAVEADQPGATALEIEYVDPAGQRKVVKQEVKLSAGSNQLRLPLRIDQPRRWFPVGYGEQSLYTFTARIGEAQATRRTGLRKVALLRERDQWGRSMAFVINDIPVFAKGANVIPFDSFANRVDRSRYARFLRAAREDNFNMLRAWGGGYYESDDFYELTDELGLLVWQDFMFGNPVPPADDPAFRASVRAEAIDQLTRLRDHPSIVLWCGNNEIETGWAAWGDRQRFKKEAPERAAKVWQGYLQLFNADLRELVAQHDGDVPYWSSSPGTNLQGEVNVPEDGDMHVWNVWSEAPINAYLDTTPRFSSEFGLQAWPVVSTIRTIAPQAQWGIDAPVIRAHQKSGSGNGNQRILGYVRDNYGEPKDFESFVYLSQVMQAEGIELAALHLRSNRPRTMGSLYWQFNDVWPGASWSSHDYYGRRKALAFHARRFYSPLSVAPIRNQGQVKVALISDRVAPLAAQLRVRVIDFHGRTLRDERKTMELPALTSTIAAVYSDAELLNGADPRRTAAVFDLMVDGRSVSRQLVYFGFAKDLLLPDPQLSTRLRPDGDGYRLEISAQRLAREVWIDAGPLDIEFEDNALTLLPGETRSLRFASKETAATIERELRVRDLHDAAAPSAPASQGQ